MGIALFQLTAGLILLVLGGEILVRGASGLALAARLSSLFIGLTIVAFGTSMPELVISLSTALKGEPSLSLGNVVGSNIFNVLFILGVSALAVPLAVKWQIVRLDVPVMIGLSTLFCILAYDGQISQLEGGLFVLGLLGYTSWAYWCGKNSGELQESSEEEVTVPATGKTILWQLVLLVAGFGLLIGGCEIFVRGSVSIAEWLGLTKAVIGLTVLAVGTSLPELVTSVMAGIKGEREIAIGNVLGSNCFNLLGVLGISALIAPGGMLVPNEFLTTSLPVMLASAFLCLPIFLTGLRIDRWEGLLFLGLYLCYSRYLVLQVLEPVKGESFLMLMLTTVLPAIALLLVVHLVYSLVQKKPELT